MKKNDGCCKACGQIIKGWQFFLHCNPIKFKPGQMEGGSLSFFSRQFSDWGGIERCARFLSFCSRRASSSVVED